MSQTDISIVIVNYNVKDYLTECLSSIKNALDYSSDVTIEVIVIDNASVDGSKDYFKDHFDWIDYTYSEENLGFGKANNIGIDKAKGTYTLLLNPDTVIEKDTLSLIKKKMDSNPEIWAAGCKVLNTDGSFQLACRRGFPTVWNSFCKLFGLQSAFPKVKLFSGYNKLYLSPDDEYDIEAIIGAFMFFRTDKLKKLAGFDPEFFMYGEDIDLCKRVWDSGGSIRYFPQMSIIHHKGESTKRSDINSLRHFYDAMSIYTKKHTSNSKVMLGLLAIAIKIRSSIAFLLQYKSDISIFSLDIIILMAVSISATKYVKGEFFNFPDWAYPDVFFTLIIIQFLSFFSLGLYFEKPLNAARAIPAILLNFLLLSSLTYYFNEYAFSRGIILLTSVIGGGILIFYRLFADISNGGSLKNDNIYIHESLKDNEILHRANMIRGVKPHFYSEMKELPFTKKLIIEPDDLIDYIANTPFIYRETGFAESYNINLPRNRFFKRIFDISVSILSLSILLPITVFHKKTALYLDTLLGKKSIVGIIPTENHKFAFNKIGVTNIALAYGLDSIDNETAEKMNMKYLKSYTLVKDIEIIFKTLLRK